MSYTKRTPTPWVKTKIDDVPDRTYSVGKLFYNVADVGCEADADFILESCNSYQALKEQNAELLAALIELEKVESSPHSETIRFLAREQARAAISKATGGTS